MENGRPICVLCGNPIHREPVAHHLFITRRDLQDLERRDLYDWPENLAIVHGEGEARCHEQCHTKIGKEIACLNQYARLTRVFEAEGREVVIQRIQSLELKTSPSIP